MGFCWKGFRKVRDQVRKRVKKRLVELGLTDLTSYLEYLADVPGEWNNLRYLCRITISRFYRDRSVFNALRWEILPQIATRTRSRGETAIRVWCAGCASGEEVYSLTMLWYLLWRDQYPTLRLRVFATDIDPELIRRAKEASYGSGSLKELPHCWRACLFNRQGDRYVVRRELRSGITWAVQDLRQESPDGPFDLVLCRYLAFTYFDEVGQAKVQRELTDRLSPGGFLILGQTESIPSRAGDLSEWVKGLPVYVKKE